MSNTVAAITRLIETMIDEARSNSVECALDVINAKKELEETMSAVRVGLPTPQKLKSDHEKYYDTLIKGTFERLLKFMTDNEKKLLAGEAVNFQCAPETHDEVIAALSTSGWVGHSTTETVHQDSKDGGDLTYAVVRFKEREK